MKWNWYVIFWLQLNQEFPFDQLAPLHLEPNGPPVKSKNIEEIDRKLFNSIISFESFDPFLDRVNEKRSYSES